MPSAYAWLLWNLLRDQGITDYWAWEDADLAEIVGRRNRVQMRLGHTYSGAVDGSNTFPLRVGKAINQTFATVPDGYQLVDTQGAVDPQVHGALHDMSLLILRDVRLAAEAAYYGTEYPGVDEGIEPVSDEHVALVIWATQRELIRERRFPLKYTGSTADKSARLPALQLGELPWGIQRAFAERRRKHYADYGIGKWQWENNCWTLEGVREDPDWLPPWIPPDTLIVGSEVVVNPPNAPVQVFDPWAFFP